MAHREDNELAWEAGCSLELPSHGLERTQYEPMINCGEIDCLWLARCVSGRYLADEKPRVRKYSGSDFSLSTLVCVDLCPS